MRIYPVIDIKGGLCVRMKQGNIYNPEIYSRFPVQMAQKFEQLGASYLHIIDLDGAMTGRSANDDIIKEIKDVTSIPFQVGGGIRTIKDIETKLLLGAERVIIGTKAVTDMAFVKEAIRLFGPDKIVIGVDSFNDMIAIEGWGKLSSLEVLPFAKRMKESGVNTIVYTDILKDGMMTGPSIEKAKRIKDKTGLSVILSGGVSSLKDIETMKQNGLDGIVVGKALYEHKFDLRHAIELFEKGE